MGMFVNGLNGGIGALMSEAYPTVARATAQNTLWNLGRRCIGDEIFLSRSDRASRLDLFPGHHRDAVFDPELKGKALNKATEHFSRHSSGRIGLFGTLAPS